MRLYAVACGALIAVALGVPSFAKSHLTPAQEWEKWRKEENAGWKSDKYALLKIDDAVYLKPGEAATLAPEPGAVPHFKFALVREASRWVIS